MVTFAQAQERAEEWVNGDVPAYQHREVRVREFGLGFVVWAEDRADGPRSDGGGQRLVIARDSGEATLWPALPVGEVIRRYEEEYGRDETAAEEPALTPARVDLNQTSFLLSPPEWLQEAADRLGIPDRRGETSGVRRGRPRPPVPVLVRVPCRGRRVRRTRAGRRRPRVRAGVPARPGPRSRPRVPVRRLPLPLPTAAGRRGRRPAAVRTRARRGPVRTPRRTAARTARCRCRRPCTRRR